MDIDIDILIFLHAPVIFIMLSVDKAILYHSALKLKLNLKPNKAIDENSSLSYGPSPATWDHSHTVLYLPADTSKRAPP